MLDPSRFPAPWRVERVPGGWRVHDAVGQALAFVYCSDASSSIMTVDEAQQIAAQIARLPELLKH